MKYLFSDFYFLCGAAAKETHTVGDAYRRMAELMGIPVTENALLFTLKGLYEGGYIQVSPDSTANGVITASTPLSVTEAGQKAATVSGLQKLFGEAKAFNKNEVKFCGLERPEISAELHWTVDMADFSPISRDMLMRREIALPLFELTECENEMLTLIVHHPADRYCPEEDTAGEESGCDPDEAEMTDSVSVTGSAERILQAISDLLTAAQTLMSDSRTRKVALHGVDRSYIVTLAHTASEYGTSLRMTVEPIRFNRQRFYGKRDGELDYAQCGSPCQIHEMSGAKSFAALLLPCAVALPKYLSDSDAECLHKLHRLLK